MTSRDLSDGDGRNRPTPPTLVAALRARPERDKKPSLKDLVDCGLLTAGTTLRGFYNGAEYHAIVDDQGHLHFETGEVATSLTAAVQIVTRRPRPPGGWTWWHVREDWRLVPLAELRERARL